MLGETLKKRREEAGLDLREVARTLGFQYDYLDALEREDISKLPPEVYVKAYIRGYAKLLNIDPLPLLDEYAGLGGAGGKGSGEVQQEPPRTRKPIPVRRIALVVLILSALALVPVVFKHLPYPQKTAPPATAPIPVPQADTPLHAPQGDALSKGLQQHVLKVTATETAWLLVETGEGISEEALLKQGETREWTSESGMDLKIGNAGGIRLMFDGSDLGAPGEKGQVVKLRLP